MRVKLKVNLISAWAKILTYELPQQRQLSENLLLLLFGTLVFLRINKHKLEREQKLCSNRAKN